MLIVDDPELSLGFFGRRPDDVLPPSRLVALVLLVDFAPSAMKSPGKAMGFPLPL